MRKRRNMEVLSAALAWLGSVAVVCSASEPPDKDARATTPSSARTVMADSDPTSPSSESTPQTTEANDSPVDQSTPTEGQIVDTARPTSPADVVSDETLPPAKPGDRLPARGTSRLVPATSTKSPWYRNGFVSLAVVLALIFGAVWVLRRFVPGARLGASGPVSVVGRAQLSPKLGVALLQVGRRHVLVGVTSDRLINLGHIVDPDESFRIRAEASENAPASAHRFDKLLGEEASTYLETESEAPLPPAANTNQLAETMGQLKGLLGRLRSMQEPGR